MAIDYTHPRRRPEPPSAAPAPIAAAPPASPPRPISFERPGRHRSRPQSPAPARTDAPPPPAPPPPPAVPPAPPPPVREPEQALPADDGPELNPEIFLLSVLDAEIRWRAESARARADHERLQRLVEQALDMRGQEPSHLTVDRDLLAREQVDVSELEDLLGRYRSAYGMSGQIRKVSLRGRIDQACAALVQDLQQRERRARQVVAGAERDYADALADLSARRPEIDVFLARRPFLYDRERDYVGQVAARVARGIQPHILHSSWDAQPIENARWAELPFVAVRGLTWLPGPGADYAAGCSAVRTQVLEQMANAFPRQLIVTWIDPVGRGASAGALLELLEIDKDLLDTQVWVEPDEIERTLRRITERMAYLEQRCLKSRFADLDEYNLQAGSLAEPRHVVAVTGYPRNFTDETRARLAQIEENGPRLGITVHMVADESTHQPALVHKHGFPAFHGVTFPGVTTGVGLGGHIVIPYSGRPHVMTWATCVEDVVWLPARFPTVDEDRARRIVEGYAHAAVEAGNVVVDSESITSPGPDGGGAWSAQEIVLPVGALGRGDRFDLRLGRGLAQNVLVGGLPGSGKSSLFHTIITAAVRHYDPTELELYLLDFKEGVEFQAYAAAELPHARVVAVQSERAFGLSVLRGLQAELTARASRFKSVGASSIAEFRDRTGEALPRVLVVVDEFQMLFAEEDATAFDCASLLEALIRQGRSYGVHTILGTQTMRGATQRLLGAALELVAIRIALKTSESDSELFLAAGNRAASRLTRPGEAIFNPDGGSPEGNLTFQVALTSEDTRNAVLREARERARSRGWTRKPLIFDGTRPVSVADDERIADLLAGRSEVDPRALRLHWGLPVAVGGDGSVSLWRRGGAHALLVGRDQPAVLGALIVALVTAHAGGSQPLVTVVECLGVDEDHGTLLADAGAQLPDTRYLRRRALPDVLAEFAAEVRRRTDEDDYGARRMLLVINAVQRARELDDADAYEPSGPSGDLASILRDGADVGIHVVMTADSLATVQRRLGRDNLARFGLRLVGPCSAEASDVLVGNASGARLGDAYMLVVDTDESRTEQVRPFPVPDTQWLRESAAAVRQISNRR